MMLENLGEDAAAQILERAIITVLSKLQSLSAGKMGYTTTQVGDLIVAAIVKS
jgi:3-isopropylmalate dehydrogenase